MPMTRGRTLKNLPKVKKTVKITKTVKVPQMKDTQKAGVLAVVRRMLARNLENKVIGLAVEYNTLHNSSIAAADCRPLVAEISPIDSAAGNTVTQRIGDRIKPKSLKVKGIVSIHLDGQQTQKDIYVRLVIASQKDVKVGSQILGGNIDTARLLSTGYAGVGNDQVNFQGYAMDTTYPINKDKFRVYMDKIVKLSACAPTGVEGLTKYSSRWSYTFKQLPSFLTYDEGNGDWANNFAPFFALGYAYSDGTVPDTVTTQVRSNVYSRFEFEDA